VVWHQIVQALQMEWLLEPIDPHYGKSLPKEGVFLGS